MPIAASSPPEPPAAGGAVGERCASPGLLLATLGHHAMRRLREAHVRHDLSPRQFQLLALLHDNGPTGQRELGATMATDPSILVALLNPLEDDGLISRTREPGDRRRHLVALTARGTRRLNAALRAQRAVEDELFGGLDTDQRKQLRLLLVAVRDGLPGEGRSVAAADVPCPTD